MKLLQSSGPIIACSTNINSNTAIAIIRLSGFEDISFLKSAFSIKKIKPRYAHFCKLFGKDQVVLDEIILTYFPAPSSYTGENTLELSVHGNRINVENIINYFIENYDFNRALPGEFSYRALKNNKLSLSQVEGLDLLINANSNFILKQGYSLLSGDLQDKYLNLQKSFLRHKSALELSIDFLEDVGEEQSKKNFEESLNELVLVLESLSKKVVNRSSSLLEPEIVLYGDPNAGKSTFFNGFLGENRSIVTDIAGTTRDFISESINIEGNFFKLVDTAGIRNSKDIIENEGINRSKDKAKKAFVKILLLNPNQKNSNIDTYLSFKPDLIIITHIDSYKGDIEHFIKTIGPIEPGESGPIEPGESGPIEPGKSGPIEPIIIKANLLVELNKINRLVAEFANKKYLKAIKNSPLVLDRHRDLIFKLLKDVNNYKHLSSVEHDISILSSELNIIGDCISELIGIVSPDDVLHNIFNNFCIGK